MEDELVLEAEWEEDTLFQRFDFDVQEALQVMMKKYKNYSFEEALNIVVKRIPEIIRDFKDCTSDEEYRMLAKKSDGTLATIKIRDPKSGFSLYKPIELNAKEYKQFYFQTLCYSLIFYFLFYKDATFELINNDEVISIFSITDETLPHLLGLENRFVSNKDCDILGKIIPDYNTKSIIGKIVALIENNEKIIEYEEKNNVDIFNYYKNMQKNKEFLMLGKLYTPGHTSNITVTTRGNNQLCLLKKSRMNTDVSNNICKIILQESMNGDHFPRSLQAIPEEIVYTEELESTLDSGKKDITIDGRDASISFYDNYITVELKGDSSNNTMYFCTEFAEILAAPWDIDYYKERYNMLKGLSNITNIDEEVFQFYFPPLNDMSRIYDDLPFDVDEILAHKENYTK